MAKTPPIQDRKAAHIRICLEKDVQCRWNPWDDVLLPHSALPEADLDDIDCSCEFLGKRLKYPLMVAAITGGWAGGRRINADLARACAELGIGLGVGSQRPAVENPKLAGTYSVVRDYDVPLVLGNIGAPQLVEQRSKRAFTADDVVEAARMVDADAVCVHLNDLQEVVQPEGDHRMRGVLEAVKSLCGKVTIVAKETGAGVDRAAAVSLKEAGVSAIDVGGYGGTSFSAVEIYRASGQKNRLQKNIGAAYRDWGIPTPASLRMCRVGLPLIGTGGVRSGLDAVRAVVVGANIAGMAGAVLPHAVKGYKPAKEFLETVCEQFRAGMFLLGARNVSELAGVRWQFAGRLADWGRMV